MEEKEEDKLNFFKASSDSGLGSSVEFTGVAFLFLFFLFLSSD